MTITKRKGQSCFRNSFCTLWKLVLIQLDFYKFKVLIVTLRASTKEKYIDIYIEREREKGKREKNQNNTRQKNN